MIVVASLLWLGGSSALFPKCSDGYEPSLARIVKEDSEHQLAEALTIECSDGRPLTLFSRGTRLPASYEDSFLAMQEDADEIQLYFPGLGLFVSHKLRKWPGGLPHMKATMRVDEEGLVTLTVVPIGSVRVEKAGAR
jgi:hypothetical protein